MVHFGLPAYFTALRPWLDMNNIKSASPNFVVKDDTIFYNTVVNVGKRSKILYDKEYTYEDYIKRVEKCAPLVLTKPLSVGLVVTFKEEFFKTHNIDSSVIKGIRLYNIQMYSYKCGHIRNAEYLSLHVDFADDATGGVMLTPITSLCGAYYANSLLIHRTTGTSRYIEKVREMLKIIKAITYTCGYGGFYYYTSSNQGILVEAFTDIGKELAVWRNPRSGREITTWFFNIEGVEVK